jgi:hypothetical protein
MQLLQSTFGIPRSFVRRGTWRMWVHSAARMSGVTVCHQGPLGVSWMAGMIPCVRQ